MLKYGEKRVFLTKAIILSCLRGLILPLGVQITSELSFSGQNT